MTTVRDRVLPAINSARILIQSLGFRRQQLTIIRRAWSSGRVGVGAYTDTRTAIVPAPKTRIVSLQEVAASAGTLQEGDMRLEKITPIVVIVEDPVVHAGTGSGTLAVTSNPPATGVTQGEWQLVVEITADGGVGVGEFRYSTNGGTSFSASADIPAAFQVPGIGALLTFSGSFDSGDTYSVNGTSIGWHPQQLKPTSDTGGVQIFYELNGEEGVGLYTLAAAHFDRALRTTLFVRRTRLTP